VRRKRNFLRGKPPTEEDKEAFKGNVWRTRGKWLENYLKDYNGTHPPPQGEYGPSPSIQTTDFLIRGPGCRHTISQFLKSSTPRTEDKRRLIQILINSFPVNAFTSKFKETTLSNRCNICRRIREEKGEIVVT
jgi:hypothetical protein